MTSLRSKGAKGNASKMVPAKLPNSKTLSMREKKKDLTSAMAEGEKLEDFIQRNLTLQPNTKKSIFEHLVSSRIVADGFLQYRDRNTRLPVPIPEKRRVKLAKDDKETKEDYVPGQYLKLDNSEYVFLQAPTKDDYQNLWRLAWILQLRVIICLSDKLSATDATLCYPYFPIDSKSPVQVESGKMTVVYQSKTVNKGYTVYKVQLRNNELKPEETVKEGEKEEETTLPKNSNCENNITLFHLESWPQNTWPDLDCLTNLLNDVFKLEMGLLRESLDNYTAPVLIQSHDAVGRAAVAWVGCMIYKDTEKRDCFDVEEYVRKIAKMRPGAFTSYQMVCSAFCLALKIAEKSGWTNTPADTKQRIAEIEKGCKDRKLP
ncbi:unnamed protein product [Caenorhabditis auriculariae]|uniref:Tyrosine-protein phosphatase domain-containing protein n=1 Tax=Caenorhabditis auriculariae TaxID=2777116 RepID=A0A8S1GZT7_9PELO|nr:unnamed protein product [Caenorhabditis auriculariae]